MKIGGIITNDLANGPGIRVSVFVSGCPHHCEGCHNMELWDFEVGTDFSDAIINKIIAELQKDGIKRDLSILGGEPLAPQNIKEVIYLCAKIREKIPNINIWLWTGYDLENSLKSENKYFICEIIPLVDAIVDGPFLKDFKVGKHLWRGSSNQRIWEKDESGILKLKED